VRSCRNGREAFTYLKQHPSDIRLLITDLIMPVMDGGELAERAREFQPKLQRGNRSAAGPAADPVPLRSVADILALVEQVVGDAYAMDLSAERCRVLLTAAGQAMKAIEVGEIEARLEALEQRANLGRTA
jgi:CheY-like chemotaxis protein